MTQSWRSSSITTNIDIHNKSSSKCNTCGTHSSGKDVIIGPCNSNIWRNIHQNIKFSESNSSSFSSYIICKSNIIDSNNDIQSIDSNNKSMWTGYDDCKISTESSVRLVKVMIIVMLVLVLIILVIVMKKSLL